MGLKAAIEKEMEMGLFLVVLWGSIWGKGWSWQDGLNICEKSFLYSTFQEARIAYRKDGLGH